jgi:hypothetical protein
MKVTVTTLTDFIFVLDVSEDLELENFKAFCEVETGFPATEIVIAFNGMPLMDNKKSLKAYGIRDGDAVILQHMLHAGSSQSSFEQVPGSGSSGVWIRSGIVGNSCNCSSQSGFQRNSDTNCCQR